MKLNPVFGLVCGATFSDELNAAFVAQSVNGEVGLPLPFSLGLLAAGAAVAGWIFLSPFVF